MPHRSPCRSRSIAGRPRRTVKLSLVPPLRPARHHPFLPLGLVESKLQSMQRAIEGGQPVALDGSQTPVGRVQFLIEEAP